VANAVSAVGDVRYSNQFGGSMTPTCDCAGFADQVFMQLGGFQPLTFFGDTPYDIEDWLDVAGGQPMFESPSDVDLD
jgi:hypothetical protein